MSVFETIGFVVTTVIATKILYNVCYFVFTLYFGSWLGYAIDVRKYGPWAVITGSTDGIGKAYAFNLAAKGLNIVLISRTPEKLRKVATQIEETYGVKTKRIAVDFTNSDGSIYETLRSELQDIDVGILINNVGMVSDSLSFFHDMGDNDIYCQRVINCNTMPVVRLTNIVLPVMLQKRRGIIINIASLTATLPTPYYTVYGATKAFVEKFSRDLTTELQSRGIVIQTVLPGYVITNMTNRSMADSFATPGPATYVESQLRTLGLEKRTAGYWFHNILLYFGELLDYFAPRINDLFMLKLMQVTRKKDIVPALE